MEIPTLNISNVSIVKNQTDNHLTLNIIVDVKAEADGGAPRYMYASTASYDYEYGILIGDSDELTAAGISNYVPPSTPYNIHLQFITMYSPGENGAFGPTLQSDMVAAPIRMYNRKITADNSPVNNAWFWDWYNNGYHMFSCSIPNYIRRDRGYVVNAYAKNHDGYGYSTPKLIRVPSVISSSISSTEDAEIMYPKLTVTTDELTSSATGSITVYPEIQVFSDSRTYPISRDFTHIF